MSLPQEQQELQSDFGGRRKMRHTKKHNKNVIIVGKVYADWCGHCQALKPEWEKMKKHIRNKKGKYHIVYEEIEEKQIGDKLKKLNETQRVNVEANGYPTLFRISNGKVDYYNGNRQSNAMADWYLRGGDPLEQQLPELMQDQQGGRRYRFRRQHNRTRKHVEKKTTGMFDFLFGK